MTVLSYCNHLVKPQKRLVPNSLFLCILLSPGVGAFNLIALERLVIGLCPLNVLIVRDTSAWWL